MPAPRSDRARTATLDATLALLTELPYPQLTMEAIAARAGVSKATVYRWWRSKGAVVVEALAERSRAQDEYALPDTGDLEADLALVLRAVVDELADPAHDALLRALSVETLLDPTLREQVLDSIFRPQLEAFAARFAAARDTGLLDPDVDDLEAMELVVAPVFHRWQQGTAPLTHAYADGVARRALRAMAAAPGTTVGYEVFHRDVGVVADFYVRVLGFVREAEGTEEHVVVVRDDLRVGISRFADALAAPRRPPHGSEIVLRVADVTAEHARVVAAGHEPADDLQRRPWGLTDFRVLDPSGQYVRVSSR